MPSSKITDKVLNEFVLSNKYYRDVYSSTFHFIFITCLKEPLFYFNLLSTKPEMICSALEHLSDNPVYALIRVTFVINWLKNYDKEVCIEYLKLESLLRKKILEEYEQELIEYCEQEENMRRIEQEIEDEANAEQEIEDEEVDD